MKREHIVAIYTAEVIIAILVAMHTLNSACERFGTINVVVFLAIAFAIITCVFCIWCIVGSFVD